MTIIFIKIKLRTVSIVFYMVVGSQGSRLRKSVTTEAVKSISHKPNWKYRKPEGEGERGKTKGYIIPVLNPSGFSDISQWPASTSASS